MAKKKTIQSVATQSGDIAVQASTSTLSSEIARLTQAKSDIKAAIEAKGVTVGDGTIDTYASKIAEISSGGSLIESSTGLTPSAIIITLHIHPYGASGGSAQSLEDGQSVAVQSSNITTIDFGMYNAPLIINGNIYSAELKRSLFDNDTKTRTANVIINVGIAEPIKVIFGWTLLTSSYIFNETSGCALIGGSFNTSRHEVVIDINGLSKYTSYSFSLIDFPE